MPRGRMAMESIDEILRRHHECKRSQRKIARSCGLSAGAVNGLLQRVARRAPAMLQEHKAGEKLFVDCAGQTVPVRDPAGGAPRAAQVFVAVLGASSYCYAEVGWGQGVESWIAAHVRALEHFGGSPELLVPDYVPGNIIGLMCPSPLCALCRPSASAARTEPAPKGT